MIRKTCLLFSILIWISFSVYSQDTIASRQPDSLIIKPLNSTVKNKMLFKIKPAVDIPITLAGVGWSIYGFSKIYSKPYSSEEEINNLNIKDINGFDRWAAGVHSDKADANSNILFYGSIPLPFFLFLDKDIRKDAGKISFLYLETMAITGIFYTGTAFLVDRYRPEAYDTTWAIQSRVNGIEKNAFLAGHPDLVATTTFFMAKIFNTYHPESNFKYVLYGFAIAATGTTVYLRHIAGKHFPSDLITGVTVGTLTGLLVPQFHREKNKNMSLIPYYNGKTSGVALIYNLK